MYRETSLFFILLNIILTLNSRASENADPFYYENTVYREEIKSVQLYREGNELSNPVIELGSDAKLVLKFDELAEDAKNYFYTIIHCDASWNESYIQQSEYLNGFADNPLTDFAMSFNTTVKFVNYQLLIPNDECTPRYSGNYVLVIFEDNNRENLVLIQRFYIVEPLVRIEGLVKKATFDPFNGENQEVDFKIVNDQLNLLNPRKDIKVVLMQNRRSDNAIVDLKPNFIRDNVLDYDYSKENVFPGGNEFRYFDIRTKRYNGENVDNIKFIRPYYHVTLRPDELYIVNIFTIVPFSSDIKIPKFISTWENIFFTIIIIQNIITYKIRLQIHNSIVRSPVLHKHNFNIFTWIQKIELVVNYFKINFLIFAIKRIKCGLFNQSFNSHQWLNDIKPLD